MPGTTKVNTASKKTATKKQAKPEKTIPVADSPKYGIGLATKAIELPLPSGNTCLAIRPGPQGLIKAGLLDSLDQLTATVQSEHIDSKDPKKALKAGVENLKADPKKLIEGLDMVDRAVAYIVQEPKIWMDEYEPDGITPKPRQKDRIYADMVDLEDRMFIFQWAVGGSSDLDRFRQESIELMGNVPTV